MEDVVVWLEGQVFTLVILHLLAMLAGAASSVRGGTNISVSTLDGQQASNTHRRVRQKSTLHAQDAGGQTESLHLSSSFHQHYSATILIDHK